MQVDPLAEFVSATNDSELLKVAGMVERLTLACAGLRFTPPPGVESKGVSRDCASRSCDGDAPAQAGRT